MMYQGFWLIVQFGYINIALWAVRVISEEHLRERVINKYHSLQKTLRSAGHVHSTRVSAVASVGASATQRLGEPGDPPPLTKGVRQSRQLGVSSVCLVIDSDANLTSIE